MQYIFLLLRRSLLLWALPLLAASAKAQNVGIGVATPLATLHVKSTAREVIRLQASDPIIGLYNNAGTFSGYVWANVAFGNDLRLGTPAASNTSVALAPNENVVLMAAANGRVGIGNAAPGTRLDIGGTDGWNLVDGEGDVRIGNSSYRLKMGVALGGGGAGAANIMQSGGIGALGIGAGSKYLLQLSGPGGYVDFQNNTGGIRINGSAGSAGQYLRSNGNAAPSWASIPAPSLINLVASVAATGTITDGTGTGGGTVPGLSYNFNLAGNARVVVLYNVSALALSCAFCGSSTASMSMYVDGILVARFFDDIPNGADANLSGSQLLNLGAGAHTVQINADGIGPDVRFGPNGGVLTNNMIVQIFPQ